MAPGLLYTTDLKEQNKMREDRVQPKAEHIQGSRSSVWCAVAVGRQWVIRSLNTPSGEVLRPRVQLWIVVL